jgi:hypothetical protein
VPRCLAIVVLGSVAAILAASPLRAEDRRATTVGMPAHIEQIVLPGSELEVKPLDDRQRPIVLRIVKAFPHGTAFRYDLVYYGMDPGEFDLRDYVRRKDGSAIADLPPLRVKIESVLGAGQVLPTDLKSSPTPALGGYRYLLIGLGIVWLIGFPVILFVRRRRHVERVLASKPLTLADQLRPLVERAMSGDLAPTERAGLERILLAYWRKRLHIEQSRPAEAFARMRAHPEAGPLLEQLEAWLHKPIRDIHVDLAALLQPYRNAPVAEEPADHGEMELQQTGAKA